MEHFAVKIFAESFLCENNRAVVKMLCRNAGNADA